MLDKLQHFLDNTPDEEIKRLWESGNYLDKRGLKITDWLKQKGNMQGKGNNIDELCKMLENHTKYSPMFKTIEIDRNFDYDSCRPGSNDCEGNYIHFCYDYDNNDWRKCGYNQIHELHMQWLTNPLATTYKDTDGETVFALKKEH